MKLKWMCILAVGCVFSLYSCEEKKKGPIDRKPVEIKRVKPQADLQYHFAKPAEYLKEKKLTANEWAILAAVNRADSAHIVKMDSIIVPSEFNADIAYYLPFPFSVPALEEFDKIIFFSYPSQSFGAYEYGQLVYTGPTNMGRKADQTPTGLFFTNWKAKETTSTFNDEWELKWNFNIENKLGVGWHQYEMPGYPASHSCLRLLEKDARYLYDWADQWKLHGTDSVAQKGTPVIVFGNYSFDGPKPWYSVIDNPHILDISAKDIESVTKPYSKDIFEEQRKRLGYE